MKRKWFEFIFIYVLLPLSAAFARIAWKSFSVIPLLWIAAIFAHFALRHAPSPTRPIARYLWRGLFLQFSIAAIVLVGGLWLIDRGALFSFPQKSPRLWGIIMFAYPLLSVVPQGMIYRRLFFARYASLFGERFRVLAAALAFMFCHIFFLNFWALLLTFAGGIIFSRAYLRGGGRFANIAHAAFGDLIFTVGWGQFLYHGTQALLAR